MLTAQSPAYEYQVGGSLSSNAPSYIRRRADEELYQALLRSEFCYVLNARQMGKSSLRVQTMSRLQAVGVRCGVLDITTIGSQQVTPEQWYASVAAILISSFQLQVDLRSWWRERSHLSFVSRLNEFLETILLAAGGQNIVIFIDEVDSVLGLKFPIDDFFALIRAIYNKRAEQPAYRRLTFALLGVATPADLIADKTRAPFNIGRAIPLRGFRFSEAMPLLPGLGRISNPEAVFSQILVWTGGQPFLTQKLCQLVLQVGSGGSTGIEQIVRSHIIDNWEAQDEPEHLKTIRDRLLHNQQRAGRLLGLYQQILQQPELAANDSKEQVELLLSGLVVKSKGKLTISNHIYQAVFNPNWVDKQLSKLRPYSEALTGWLNSNCLDESRLLRGKALQDALDWSASHSLSDQDYQFLAASQELDRQHVQHALAAEQQAKTILAQRITKPSRRFAGE